MKTKLKETFFILLTVCLCLTGNVWAVDTSGIDDVRKKEVLNGDDLQIIDTFLKRSIDELVQSDDFETVVSVRSAISARNSSQQQSAQIQYAPQFAKSAQKYLSQALEELTDTPKSRLGTSKVLNTMILIGELADMQTAQLCLSMIDNPDITIRYWAIKALANKAIAEQINQQVSDPVVLKIVDGLAKAAGQKKNADMAAMIAEFAAELNGQQGENLLIEVLNGRMELYRQWQSTDSAADAIILDATAKRIENEQIDKKNLSLRFAQLYSYMIQRYILAKDTLDEKQKVSAVSGLIEVQNSYNSFFDMPQRGIQRALEKDDMQMLKSEHNELLGSEQRQGTLPKILDFDYGITSDGANITAPMPLPNPPEKSS